MEKRSLQQIHFEDMSKTDQALILNIQEQLKRVMVQLSDLEKEKDAFDKDEYAEMKADSMDQLKVACILVVDNCFILSIAYLMYKNFFKELEQTLDRMQCGDISLTDKVTATKLAIRAAISEAFRTPEVVAFFANKQPAMLRQELVQVEAGYRLHKLTEELYISKKMEILLAVFKLGDKLSDDEKQFLEKFSSKSFSDFELASPELSCNEFVVNRNISKSH
ncbi:unnamed protein product [Enterobius vermicularis]|uniref:Protein LZIC n=1 Tax=Enterobius vermicularis TaxID=51028 RepID=A0A0N4V205_ENTVE|nr:unnamed protein product [Enterobius vermicularis]